MPKGKEYSAKQIQAMRDEGVFSPSEIQELERSAPDNSSRSNPELKILREQGVYSPSEIDSIEKRGYKYFPDN